MLYFMVLDVMMFKLNGWEVCKYVCLKEVFNDVGIVMFIVIGFKFNELILLLYGVDEYLDKFFDFDELEVLIEKVFFDCYGIMVSQSQLFNVFFIEICFVLNVD